jgi:hypothetical protein
VRDGLVESMLAATVCRILLSQRLKPWWRRVRLAPEVLRDAAFAAWVQEIHTLDTRPPNPDEVVGCAD